jgi:ribosomal protein L37AE/L43A
MFAMTEKIETAVLTDRPIAEPAEAGTRKAALWVCDHCQVWRGSQNGYQPEARYLLRLAEPHTELFKWEDYRGWREQADIAQLCPECGRETAHPRFSLLGQVNGRAA